MIAGLSLIAIASIVPAISAGFGFVSPWLTARSMGSFLLMSGQRPPSLYRQNLCSFP